MIDLTYHIKGVDLVLRELAGVRLDTIQGDVTDILDDIAQDAADYPPERPNQRYVRSGDLGRGWTESEPMLTGSVTSLLAVLTNSVSYGPFVQGTEDQSTVHAKRWKTTDQITAAWEDRAAQRIEQALGKLIKP